MPPNWRLVDRATRRGYEAFVELEQLLALMREEKPAASTRMQLLVARAEVFVREIRREAGL